MFDLNSLIGRESKDAENILKQNGFKNVNIKVNSKGNENCNAVIVCAARLEEGGKVTLICGEFLKLNKGK